MSKVPTAAIGNEHLLNPDEDASDSLPASPAGESVFGQLGTTGAEIVAEVEAMPDEVPLERVGSSSPAHPVGVVPVEGKATEVAQSATREPGHAPSVGEDDVHRASDPEQATITHTSLATDVQGVPEVLEREGLAWVRFLEWWSEFKHIESKDPLRVAELVTRRPPFPKRFLDHEREFMDRRLADALDSSEDYAVWFAGRVREACEALGMSVQGRGGEYAIDHFVTVKLALSRTPRIVEVSGERLDDPVTVDRTVRLIRENHAAIHSHAFRPEVVLRLLFDAYWLALSMRPGHLGSLAITLKECHRALEKVKPSPVGPSATPLTLASRTRGRPPRNDEASTATGAQVSPRRPVRETAARSETRFRSDMSRLIASGMDLVIDGHRLHLQALRGEGGMSLVEPRSRNLILYRTIEFRKVSIHAE